MQKPFWSTLGFLSIAFIPVFLFSPHPGESRDWFFYEVLSVLFLALTVFTAPGKKLNPKLSWMAIGFCLWILAASWSETSGEVSAALAKKDWMLPDFLLSFLSFMGGGILLFLDFLLIVLILRWFVKKHPEMKWEWPWLGWIFLLWLFLKLNDTDKPLVILHLKYASAFILIPILLWVANHFLKESKISKKFSGWDAAGVVLILLYLRLPTLYAQELTYHHWSFYVGPIWSVKQGGALLYDVPSQYGFLSILLPALLPFSDITSFYLAQCLVLGLLASAVFLVFKNSPLLSARKYVPWLLTFVIVFWMPGGRLDGMGVFEMPSSGAYRFAWALLLTLLLIQQCFKQTKNPWIPVLATTSVLWSIESALYTFLVLGFFWLSDFLSEKSALTFLKKNGFYLVSIFGTLAAAFLGIYLIWKAVYGVTPEWISALEYASAYKAGNAAIPLKLTGSAVCLLALMAVVWSTGDESRKHMRAVCTASGFFLATLSYLIPRSHPGTVTFLIPLWFVVFVQLFSLSDFKSKKSPMISLSLFSLIFLMLIISFGKVSRVSSFVKASFQPKFLGSLEEVFAKNPQSFRAENIEPQGELLLDTSQKIPAMNLENRYIPFRGMYPVDEFSILKPERQIEYFVRYFERNKPRTFKVLREASQHSNPVLESLGKSTEGKYRVEKEVPVLKNLVLATYVRTE